MHVTQAGSGIVRMEEAVTHLHIPVSDRNGYSNAQITSYRTRKELNYAPPLRMEVTAWAEGRLHGTAGFGFWNHPYAPGEGIFRLPKAVWFFHATPPNNMALAKGVPGYGWKAATFNAMRWQFFALLPAAPVGFLVMRVPVLYHLLWGIGQRAIGVSEHLLDPNLIYSPHHYAIEWLPYEVRFYVDGAEVYRTAMSPSGKLGFVAWVDNQYAVVTPQGRFQWGLVGTSQPQTLHLERIQIVSL
jgi:hypothetical protein